VGLQWNVQDGFYRNHPAISPEWHRTHAEILRHPVILHYTNRKPWNYDSQHPLRDVYFQYLDLTPWKGERPWHSVKNRFKRFFRLLPFYIGMRKAKYIRLASL
jgi:lipopolysaccharide biosynthesis glycosyltransferase